MAININIQVASLMPLGGWRVYVVNVTYNRVVNMVVSSFHGKPKS